MSIDVTVDETIARSIEQVFAWVADVDDWPTWLVATGIVSVRRNAHGPLTAGEEFTVVQQAAGRAGTFEAIATVVDPPDRLAVEGRDHDGVSIAIEATLTPADTATELHWTIRIGLPFRYRIFESMTRPGVERAVALDIEALRRRLESAPSG